MHQPQLLLRKRKHPVDVEVFVLADDLDLGGLIDSQPQRLTLAVRHWDIILYYVQSSLPTNTDPVTH